jgi:DNA polymerase-3 subunit alpha
VLDKFALKRMAEMSALLPGTRTRVGGMVAECRKLYTKEKQEPMASFRVEGLEGSISAIMFPRAFAQYGELIVDEATVMLGGTWEQKKDSDEKQFVVSEAFLLDQAAGVFCDRVSIHLPEMGVNEEVMAKLRKTVSEFRGPTPLHICIEFVDGPKVFLSTDHGFKVNPSAELEHRIEQTIGEGLVYIAAKSDALKYPPKPRKWEKRKG